MRHFLILTLALLPLTGSLTSCSDMGSLAGGDVSANMNRLASQVAVSLQAHRKLYSAGDHARAKAPLIKAEKDCKRALKLAESLESSDPSRGDAINVTSSLLNDIRSEYHEKYG